VARWWQGQVGYQIYLRSFADSDGDGVGDLPGIRSKLPYLAELGIDVVWITPFFPSPQADHGYDVSDYEDVDPRFGTLGDLSRLIEDAHGLGLRVVIDLVPNHTSDQHPWFLDARSSREATHRDFYVWRDPAPDGGPPNNWVSYFGGPAWSLDETSGQYYMHLFLPEQPDLNWAHPGVRSAFASILRTWFERGVDGVRIDVAHSLMEDPGYPDNPRRAGVLPEGASPIEVFESFEHLYDLDQDSVIEIYQDWNRVASEYDALLLGEVYLLDPVRLARYLTGDALHSSFCFSTLHVAWDAEEIRSALRTNVELSGDGLSWPLSSHDDPHAAGRFGGGTLGARRSLAYLTLLCGLPGNPFLYQGDELGLDDGAIDAAEDPIAVRNPGAVGRDPQRTPMIWEPGPGFGFTTGEPWLPFGTNRSDALTAAVQRQDPSSSWSRTAALLRARRGLAPLTDGSPTSWLTDDGPIVAIARGDRVVVAMHVGDADSATAALPLPRGGRLVYATCEDAQVVGDELRLAPDSAAIVELHDQEDRP
jgi:alpha-glucosidase